MGLTHRHTLEPGWCVLHCVPGPCLSCLGPIVAEMMERFHKDNDKELYLFLQVDTNDN